ncbi:hypothetical protein GCM10012287_45950 [Streptomyces daqingensis]|uniref:Uncharacterized protein n=1 Tax=Streptomyces daqingensis TaxID=1472640 RepID=A0ABQ2MMU0_9ACTN|nr:hypothetical protein GCM10012287_45950 [Streptomyces daqingensis]
MLGDARLVLPEPFDARLPYGIDHFRPDLTGPFRMAARPRGQVLRMGDAGSPALPGGELGEHRSGITVGYLAGGHSR